MGIEVLGLRFADDHKRCYLLSIENEEIEIWINKTKNHIFIKSKIINEKYKIIIVQNINSTHN